MVRSSLLCCGFLLSLMSCFGVSAQVFPDKYEPPVFAEVSFCYTYPVAREDGVALSLAEIQRIEVYAVCDTGDETYINSDTALTCFTVTPNVFGECDYAAAVVDTDGKVSRLSETDSAIVPKLISAPNPIINFGVSLP